jgi:hypothetical protein
LALKGKLTPEEQIKFLGRVYGYTRKGYVFLPWVDGSTTDKVSRRNSYHEGRAFKWPAERNTAMLDHLKQHETDDVYFCPNVFNGKRRIEQYVDAENVLYADLDPVDPHKIHDYKPTFAWESSPGRYQAIWVLNTAKTGATWDNNENHRLTKYLEADPSGWDSTQLLRIPGRPNFKYDYKDANAGEPVMGRGLLWMDGPRYTWDQFADLPEVGSLSKDHGDALDEAVLEGIDRHEVWGRVRLKLPMRIREYMKLKDVPPGADRSDVLWDISRELADAGCTAVEIVAITRPTPWNKFTNRPDELQLLLKGAVKAVHAKSEKTVEEVDSDAEPKPQITWLKDVVQQRIPRPRWLVKDIWTKGGLGFISGAPKSYKSWMAIDLAVSIATATPFLGQPGYSVDKARPVLYLQEEDDLRLVMERLALITEAKAPEQFWHGQVEYTGVHPDDPNYASDALTWTPPTKDIPLAMQVQTGFIASDPGWQAWLDEIVEQGKFAMIIIDTLGTVAGEIDTDKSGELMTRMLRPLRTIARKHDTAICVVHHNKKASNQGGRAGQDMLGSTALHAWVECALYARSKDANGEIAIEREAKLAMDMSMRVKIPMMFENHVTGMRQLWDPEIVTDGLEQIHDSPTEDRPPMNERGTAGKALAFKLKQMGKGPFTIEDIQERLGSDNTSSIRKQLTEGQRNGYFDEIDGRWSVVNL